MKRTLSVLTAVLFAGALATPVLAQDSGAMGSPAAAASSAAPAADSSPATTKHHHRHHKKKSDSTDSGATDSGSGSMASPAASPS
jgi:hypothetical protein